MKTHGVECPECGGMFTKVINSNLDIENHRVRARICQDCEHPFSTVELVVPGLSWARTQRSRRGRAIITRPQYVRVKTNPHSLTLYVEEPVMVATCRSGRHEWKPENIYHSPKGHRMCRPCRLENARERYHHARRKAPPSIIEDQRAYWRERDRIRRRRAA